MNLDSDKGVRPSLAKFLAYRSFSTEVKKLIIYKIALIGVLGKLDVGDSKKVEIQSYFCSYE